MNRAKLRIGLLLDGYCVSSWAHEMLEIIQASSHSEICLIVMPKPQQAAPTKSLLSKLKDNRRGILSILLGRALEGYYSRFLERQTYGRPSESVRDARALLGAVPVVEVDPVRTKWSDSFNENDLEAVRAHDVDVFIRLGFRILRGGILRAAKYGVWSYHHGDNVVNRGGPPGFWESMESWPETGAVLQILTEDLDNGMVLARTYSATDKFSVLDNKRNYFWKTLSLIPRKLSELHRIGPELFFEQVAKDNQSPSMYAHRLYSKPGNGEYAFLLLRKTAQKLQEMWRHRRYIDQWMLLYDIRPTLSSSLWRYKKILPPMDRFWADPHVIERNGHYYIFIEELLYKSNKGHISVIKMDKSGKYESPHIVLERPYHLSYPFIFEYEGQLYMVPESAQNNTIELYRCTDFPGKWEFVHNLMEGVKAYDATLSFHEGRWWMFVNMVEVQGASSWDELFVFCADSPLSQSWTPHLKNPVVSDCKRARPAGATFVVDGQLYRPSQNCSVKYGYGFNFGKVEQLDDHGFSEHLVTQVTPSWSPDIVATHTYSRCGDLHVIDAQLRRKKRS